MFDRNVHHGNPDRSGLFGKPLDPIMAAYRAFSPSVTAS